jgi:hypothetical protein
MNLLVIFILIFFISVIIILFINLTLGFDFAFNEHEQKLLLTFYFTHNLKKVNQVLPQNKELKEKKIKSKKSRKNKQAFKINDYQLLRKIIYVLRETLNRSLKIKDFNLDVKIGTGDPAGTALIYGALWSIAGVLSTYFFSRYKPKNKKINIAADFNKETFNVEFNCIFNIRIVNIIQVGIIFLKWYIKNRKGGDKNVKSSNRRTYEYSDGKHQGNG